MLKNKFSALSDKLRASGRSRLVKSAAAVALCASLAAGIFSMNVAFAVSVDGEFVGYAGSMDEISSALDGAAHTASAALGYDYSVDGQVDYQLTLAKADADITGAIETHLLDGIDEIGKYAIICVDGVPFCAFESSEAASAALGEYTASFTGAGTSSIRFLEDVSVKVDYADTRLLDVADDFAVNAAKVLHVETVSDVSEEVETAYDTRTVEDDSLFIGDEVVEQEGVPGRSRTLSEVTAINGEVVSSVILESEELSAPVEEIVHVGTAERLSTGSYIWPAEGLLSSYFGRRNVDIGSSNHHGIDIAGHYGDDVIAADGGTVIFAEYDGAYGNLIQIQHDNGDITYYAHCSELLKSVGDRVSQGELIAYMGATGRVSGVHVHFEYHPGGGAASDPLDILP